MYFPTESTMAFMEKIHKNRKQEGQDMGAKWREVTQDSVLIHKRDREVS